MTDENCVPVKVALQLMDTSSLGLAYKYSNFKHTHKELQNALQSIVNDHHQGFNSSIGTFHTIMKSITSSQANVRELRESLLKAKDDLSTSKPEVKTMVESSQKYDVMLQTLHQIEQLQGVPEKLEGQITEKRFLTAVSILTEALDIMKRPEMMEIGALSDLRTYLGGQEASLADILVEELHNHLYLKSLYCNDRWKAHSSGQKDCIAPPSRTNRTLNSYISKTDFTKPMTDDTVGTNKTPEVDSLNYIRLTLEALNQLGHLSNAIATVNQRLPVELNRLVDKTNREVDVRHPSALVSRKGYGGKSNDFGLAENDVRVAVVHDLLFTLYSKFEAVMEGHRIIYDSLNGIAQREDIQNPLPWNSGFVEVWQLIQSEMRSLLHDYLTMADSRGGLSSAPKTLQNALGNVITGKTARPKNRAMFKLSNTNINSTDLKVDQDDLEQILKATMPGLVSDPLRPSVALADPTQSSDGAATGHKLLIEPSVFNITLFLPPSLSFLNRLKDVVPPSCGIQSSTLPSFLDDFLVNVFYPSLEDTIRELFSQTTGDLEAFYEDPQWASISPHPIMKGTTEFLDLITAFCKMLDTLPPDQAFGQLTMDLLTSYFDKCYEWYKELVARIGGGDPSVVNGDMKVSARWSLDNKIRPILEQLWLERGNNANTINRETELEMMMKGAKDLEWNDLITDRKAINSLCLLATSMKWLAGKVTQLRHVEDAENFSKNDGGSSGRIRRRWTLIDSDRLNDENRAVHLPMTAETVNAFDGVISSYQELALTIIFTLRCESRCHTIYYLYKCLSEGNFFLKQKLTSADEFILALNSDLTWFDEDVSSLLPKEESLFTWCGLSQLMDHILVSCADRIKVLNQHGAERMLTNVLVLQQNLKNIEGSADLGRATRFYNLYNGGMEDLIRNAKSGKLDFTYDELKAIVELYFSEALCSGRASAQARQSLNENLLELSEIMWMQAEA
ncbi:hypothetical protein EX30DRAFT_306899 [Ascodesmis nigricans]|uniref:Exocyst complex component Sec8 n=1 Tax=Ascodesmis nigricans TaxID=341454 RepID=A0A4S2MWT6_9PEZI|nr:hypothetical protein EX30DRAFT_306899 [Ascodesmis nigricans]